MAGKFLCVNLHLIWSTKGRRCLIDPQWNHRLHAYMGSVARFKNARLIEANSRADHIHLYTSMPSTISIADLINALKANATRWIRLTFPNRRWFSWQEGYAAFSVGNSQEKALIEYIRIRMSITDDETLRKNSLNCSVTTGSSLTCNMFLIKCRAFGAHSSISTHFPA